MQTAPRHTPAMDRIALIGFGEAARAFTGGGLAAAAAYDIDPARRDGIAACATPAEALTEATLILSLVTADRALAAADEYARHLAPGALWCDFNSVAPATKRAAARAIEAAGGRYLDVAALAPVHPARLATPLSVSGPDADAGAARLRAAGFTNVRAIGPGIGDAAAVKMIRSVMVKGTEALTAEMLLAAEAAGVTDEVLRSLGGDWAARADYNLDRMLVHGLRRAAEMEEAAATLTALGVEPLLTRGTIARQRAMGRLGIPPPEGLTAKLGIAA